MQYVLAPNDEGIVVTLTNVAESDKQALDKAKEQGFDPTEPPFDQYYDYSRSLGFFVNRTYFDHAEHKGRRLDFSEYLKMMAGTETVTDSVAGIESAVKQMKEVKTHNDAASLQQAVKTMNDYLDLLLHGVEAATEADKAEYHKAMDIAFKPYTQANEYVAKSEYADLMKLSNALDEFRTKSGDLQAALLAKYNENF